MTNRGAICLSVVSLDRQVPQDLLGRQGGLVLQDTPGRPVTSVLPVTPDQPVLLVPLVTPGRPGTLGQLAIPARPGRQGILAIPARPGRPVILVQQVIVPTYFRTVTGEVIGLVPQRDGALPARLVFEIWEKKDPPGWSRYYLAPSGKFELVFMPRDEEEDDESGETTQIPGESIVFFPRKPA